MNNLIKDARHIPVIEPGLAVSYSPISLAAPQRGLPLELRITGPASGDRLPIVLLSHGHGPSNYIPSKDGYGPLVNFYAERGFVVIQPTHLNSKVAGLPADSAGGPLFWRSRVEDMSTILDCLDEIEAAAPAFNGRLDRDKVAVVGHSMGGQTAGMLLGARLTDPKDPTAQDVNMLEPRIKAGLILTAPGNGGDSLSETGPAFLRANGAQESPAGPKRRTPCTDPTALGAAGLRPCHPTAFFLAPVIRPALRLHRFPGLDAPEADIGPEPDLGLPKVAAPPPEAPPT